jgi:hypothetical protein
MTSKNDATRCAILLLPLLPAPADSVDGVELVVTVVKHVVG